MTEETENYKSGFISILGRPNAGKSTLLNALIGEKIAITSNKPQTTRTNIQGILTGEGHQAVFIDTPGFHDGRDKINKKMVKLASDTVETVDIIYLIIEADEFVGAEMKSLLELINSTPAVKFLLINKVDKAKREQVYQQAQKFFEFAEFKHVLPISALKGTNIDKLRELTVEELPEGFQMFEEEEVTTQPEKLLCSEFIREQVFRQMKDEIPYQVLVETEEVIDESKDKMRITASIIVNRESQKGILIGKGGERLKKIGTEARKSLETFFGVKVYLDLWVKIRNDWAEDDDYLNLQGM